jgi:hypothetical protein
MALEYGAALSIHACRSSPVMLVGRAYRIRFGHTEYNVPSDIAHISIHLTKLESRVQRVPRYLLRTRFSAYEIASDTLHYSGLRRGLRTSTNWAPD